MGLVSSIALYFVLWWLCFFVALPIGTHSHVEQNMDVDRGSEAASPVKPRLFKKVLAATVVAFGLLFLTQWILAQPGLQYYWK
jgi:predicted secreted protein